MASAAPPLRTDWARSRSATAWPCPGPSVSSPLQRQAELERSIDTVVAMLPATSDPRFAPFGLWYQDLEHAISYPAWAAREADRAEVRVFNRDGTLAECRVVGETVR